MHDSAALKRAMMCGIEGGAIIENRAMRSKMEYMEAPVYHLLASIQIFPRFQIEK